MPLSYSNGPIYNRFVEGTSGLYNTARINATYPLGIPLQKNFNSNDMWYVDQSADKWYIGQTASISATAAMMIVEQDVALDNETTRLQTLVNDKSPPAPQTFAACTIFYYNTTINGYNSLDDVQIPFLQKDSSNGQYWYAEARQALELWKSSGGGPSALWMAATDQTISLPSIGVVALQNVTDSFLDNRNFVNWQLLRIDTCSIYAGWQSSELFIDPQTDNWIHSPGLTNPTKNLEDWASAIMNRRITLCKMYG